MVPAHSRERLFQLVPGVAFPEEFPCIGNGSRGVGAWVAPEFWGAELMSLISRRQSLSLFLEMRVLLFYFRNKLKGVYSCGNGFSEGDNMSTPNIVEGYPLIWGPQLGLGGGDMVHAIAY